MIGTLRGMARTGMESKIDSLLQLLSLHPARHATMGTYSKGMRQRILLIAAIMDDPEIFIFDEPLSGLDVTSALIFKNLVQALGHAGRLVFYCSHVLEVVEKVCTDVLILRKGVVIAHDSVANVGQILGESLENTFLHLVDDVDTMRVASDIVEVNEGGMISLLEPRAFAGLGQASGAALLEAGATVRRAYFSRRW